MYKNMKRKSETSEKSEKSKNPFAALEESSSSDEDRDKKKPD